MMPFRAVARKLAYHYRTTGGAGLLRRCRDYLRDRLWSESRWIIYRRNLDEELSPPAVVVYRREIGLQELLGLPYFKAKAFPEEMKGRLARRHTCYGFFAGDRLATIGWVSAEYLELDKRLRVPFPGAAGIYDCYTFDEFRSRGYYTNALMQLAHEMKSRGLGSVHIAVDPDNFPSVRGIEKAGFRPFLRVKRRRRLGATFVGYERS